MFGNADTILFSTVIDKSVEVAFNFILISFICTFVIVYSVSLVANTYAKLLRTEKYLIDALSAYIEPCNMIMSKVTGDQVLYSKVLKVKKYAGENVKKETLQAYYIAKSIGMEIENLDIKGVSDFIENTKSIDKLIIAYNKYASTINKSFKNPISKMCAQDRCVIRISKIEKV